MSIEALSQHAAPIPEDVLRTASRTLGTLLGSGDIEVSMLRSTLDVLLTTAHLADLSSSHRVGACNVLCGVLEQYVDSKEDEIRRLAYSRATIDRLFGIYLDRYDSGKSKAMKQVLNTLVRLLARSPDHGRIEDACTRCLDLAFVKRDRSKTKPALHALTVFLSRNVLEVSELVTFYASSKGPHREGFEVEEVSKIGGSRSDLLGDLLYWIPTTDIAPAVGPLLFAICKQENNDEGVGRISLPIWAEPVVRGMFSNPTEIQSYRHHAFPALLQSGLSGYMRFLEYLGFREQLGLPVESDNANGATATISGSTSESRETKTIMLFAALQAGKSCGMIEECSTGISMTPVVNGNLLLIPDVILGQLCTKSSPEARITGLSMLVTSSSPTKPLTDDTFTCLRTHLPHMMADVDANFRGEVHSHFLALINRLRSVLAVLARQKIATNKVRPFGFKHDAAMNNNVSSEEEARAIYDTHVAFLNWSIAFLSSELVTTAAYQRHISALKCLLIMLKSGVDDHVRTDDLAKSARVDAQWPLNITVVSPFATRALIDLLLDPFDDVRQAALEILLIQISTASGESTTPEAYQNDLTGPLLRARRLMLKSGRVDQADGVSRIYSLIVRQKLSCGVIAVSDPINSAALVIEQLTQDLEAALEVASSNMTLAVRQYPIHGLLTALRYTVEQVLATSANTEDARSGYAAPFERISACIFATWSCVKGLLCNDAPEGFVPDNMEEESSLTTKDVLSFAWRGLKESSLLLRTLIGSECLRVQSQAQLDKSLIMLGNLCYTQLAELRHRGAFSTVAQTFAAVCQQCAASKNDDVKCLVQEWYKETLLMIRKKGTAITRRSAGLPAIVVGLIASDASGELYKRVMFDLAALSQVVPALEEGEAIDLPQVHALNSIRAIFISSRLAARSENSVVGAMDLAAKSLASKIWAIRNCGLMLFRSLIDRLIGSNETGDDFFDSATGNATRLAYDQYPGLLDLMLRLLRSSSILQPVQNEEDARSGDAELTAEAVFPVLDLLRRAPPPASIRDEIIDLVMSAFGDTSWHVRDMAARTVAAMTPSHLIAESMEKLAARKSNDNNELHARLVCLKHMAKSALRTSTIDIDTSAVATILHLLGNDSPVPSKCLLSHSEHAAVAAFLDIADLLGCHLLQRRVTKSGANIEDMMAPSAEGYTLPVSGMPTTLSEYLDISLGLLDQVFKLSIKQRGSALLRKAALKLSWISALVGKLIDEDRDNQLQISQTTNWSSELLPELMDSDLPSVIDNLEELQPLLSELHPEVSLSFLTYVVRTCRPSQDRLRSRVCRIMADILTESDMNTARLGANIVSELANVDLLDALHTTAAPSDVNSTLAITGYTFSCKYVQVNDWSPTVLDQAQAWLRLCNEVVREVHDFDLRQAAAMSLNGLLSGKAAFPALPDDMQVQYLLAVYTCLVDDDEEIRAVGSGIVTKVVQGTDSHSSSDTVVPPVACDMLCAYSIKHFASSITLTEWACSRLLGQDITASQLMSFESLLQEVSQADSVLFGEERQNLYVDDAKEAKTWSKVLKQVDAANLKQPIVQRLLAWVNDGLICLTKKASTERDGALGWATRPEVHTLGMRVILAAEVLLVWSTVLENIAHVASIRQSLQGLAVAGKTADLPGVWLLNLERVTLDSEQ